MDDRDLFSIQFSSSVNRGHGSMMKIETTNVAPQDFAGEAIVVGAWSSGSLPPSTADVDQASGGLVSR